MIPHNLLTPGTASDRWGLILTPGRRLAMLLCVVLLCWVVGGTLNGFILKIFGMTTQSLRIASVLQSILQIFLPAIATACVVSRRPAKLLGLVGRPRTRFVILGLLCMLAAVPVLNIIIDINRAMHLPGWARSVELLFREMENRANDSVALMQGGSSVGDLILNILIIGLMAGVGEELLFRGALQRLLSTTALGPHGAIWAAAFLFSAIHLQFYGFVPRMLLGAFFGYLLYWSGSIWVPVAAHTLNNVIYVTGHWIIRRDPAVYTVVNDNIGSGVSELVLGAISLLITVVLLFGLWRRRSSECYLEQEPSEDEIFDSKTH